MPDNDVLQSRPTPAGGSPSADSTSADPLTKLHHMSMTAGLGSGDYVAINVAAVVSLLLGIISVATTLADPLVLIPIIGLIFGIISLQQIRNSGGTQTGRILAWAGVILSLGFAGLWVSWVGWRVQARHTAGEQLQAMVERFSGSVKTGDWDTVWNCFSPQFQRRVGENRAMFKSAIQRLQAIPTGPDTMLKLSKIERGPVLFPPTQFFQRPTAASGTIQASFDGDPVPKPLSANFRSDDGIWRIDDIPALFQGPREGAGGGEH